MGDTSYEVTGTVEMVKPMEAANWTGMDLIPFETIAERFLDLEHEGHTATLTVSFGKPFVVEGKGWACPYRISALGRDHITPAGGADSVHAIQMAMHMVHNELTGMARHHKMTFLGTNDFGFGRVGGSDAAVAKCPVVGMSVSS
ncbi:DUF6968 family protein [Granulicella sibirica]|uniref:DUF6968 domain-containing protein n=1 Tax=Granulicella sibirica TaxID=2479048 RepID=A0A4Q0SZ94_9BACT|nr:hypothetical protein [Granulicella sibirica]RXH54859.1 hypothetical protein GRAN_3963 [Granulicella sibirica]